MNYATHDHWRLFSARTILSSVRRRDLEEMLQGLHDQIDRYDALSGSSYPYALIWLRDGRHIDAHFWL
jgi:hypothetical protein